MKNRYISIVLSAVMVFVGSVAAPMSATAATVSDYDPAPVVSTGSGYRAATATDFSDPNVKVKYRMLIEPAARTTTKDLGSTWQTDHRKSQDGGIINEK